MVTSSHLVMIRISRAVAHRAFARMRRRRILRALGAGRLTCAGSLAHFRHAERVFQPRIPLHLESARASQGSMYDHMARAQHAC